MMRKCVVVTGASGFIGQHLCRDLAERGREVRAVVRAEDRRHAVPSVMSTSVVTDPTSRRQWETALQGAETVVHLIARTHTRHTNLGQLEAYRRVNVRITEAVLGASALCGVERFVYLSSIKAVGEGAPVPYDESTPCVPRDAYGVTKREAELVVAKVCRRAAIDAVTLRAPLVYGPEVRGNFLESLKFVERRLPLPISGIHNKRSMLYVGNLTSACATLLACDRFPDPIFHLADGGEPLSTQDLIRRLGLLMGRRAILFPIPKLLLRLGGALLNRGDLVDRLVGSLTVSTSRIQTALNWVPPISVDEGLRRTVAWYLTRERAENP
jgi:nucleoside-diphosphate-sugar epimerase